MISLINEAGSPIEWLGAPEFQSQWDADPAMMVEAVRKIGKVECCRRPSRAWMPRVVGGMSMPLQGQRQLRRPRRAAIA